MPLSTVERLTEYTVIFVKSKSPENTQCCHNNHVANEGGVKQQKWQYHITTILSIPVLTIAFGT